MGRERDDEARLLHRGRVLARERLAVARDFGPRIDVVNPVLAQLAPPRLVAGGVGLDAEELVSEREPLLRLVRVVDAEAALEDVPVGLHARDDVPEAAVGRAGRRGEPGASKRARGDDVREELLAALAGRCRTPSNT